KAFTTSKRRMTQNSHQIGGQVRVVGRQYAHNMNVCETSGSNLFLRRSLESRVMSAWNIIHMLTVVYQK
ncbi:hypothetical protein, partial [Escherichia coli]|uniref:hypothetical protein n=1 Tax=Escherichia coli TaxID=562 RepID=UPI001BE492DA